MHRVVYNADELTGVLFFLLDSVLSGVVSLLCVGTTRRKAMDSAIGALHFISQQFGKDSTPPAQRPYESVMSIMRSLKLESKKDKRGK